jgi:hypothetical protein
MNNYKIIISGWGAELTIGTVNEKEKEIIQNKLDSDLDLHEILQFDEIGKEWYDFDDIFHHWSVSGDFTITIYENGNEILELTSEDLYENFSDSIEYTSTNIDNSKDIILCVSHEKGNFFEGEFESENFDISKLKIEMEEEIAVDDCYYYGYMISSIYYEGEEMQNIGGSTTGKSFDIYKNF